MGDEDKKIKIGSKLDMLSKEIYRANNLVFGPQVENTLNQATPIMSELERIMRQIEKLTEMMKATNNQLEYL